MKIWVFIGRMQPLHLWHQKIINESITTNDFTLIILWSSWIIDEYNPFSDLERKSFIENIFIENYKKYKIVSLEDYNSDELWVKNIENIIKINIKEYIENLTFYWWDLENDYAIKVIKHYKNELNFNKINLKEISRKSIHIIHKWRRVYISSTLVRQSLFNRDLELLEKLLDDRVFTILKNKFLK